jgi:hypothetical protein
MLPAGVEVDLGLAAHDRHRLGARRAHAEHGSAPIRSADIDAQRSGACG